MIRRIRETLADYLVSLREVTQDPGIIISACLITGFLMLCVLAALAVTP